MAFVRHECGVLEAKLSVALCQALPFQGRLVHCAWYMYMVRTYRFHDGPHHLFSTVTGLLYI